jgi:chorismate mutase
MAATMTTDQDQTQLDGSDLIETLRARIDDLDEAITRLVSQRAEVSAQIQAARVRAGGTRMELGRERVVLDHYRRELGARGPALGEAVLRVCRGER